MKRVAKPDRDRRGAGGKFDRGHLFLHGHEIPTVAWWPKAMRGTTLHADRVQLDAGRLPLAQSDALEYGQVAAWPSSAYPPGPARRAAMG